MEYFVYIIQSQVNGSLYIGQTRDLQDRLIRHNQGRSRYTKAKRPWTLLYSEQFKTGSEASKRESELKSHKTSPVRPAILRQGRRESSSSNSSGLFLFL
jgi:putative endonuclease